jgi:hypothetical protein
MTNFQFNNVRKKIEIKKILNKYSQPLVSLFYLFGLICLLISTILLLKSIFVYQEVNKYKKDVFFKNKLNVEDVHKLSVDVQIEYFENILGKARVINYHEDESKQEYKKEYIFVFTEAYIQAITNVNGKVLSYSVTTRKKDFNPEISNGLYKVVLGKTKFNEIPDTPFACFAFLGITAASYYYEYYDGSNATNYLGFMYGLNDAGLGNFDDLILLLLDEGKEDTDGWHGNKDSVPLLF